MVSSINVGDNPLQYEEAELVKISSNPDCFEWQANGVAIPVRYWTEIVSGAVVAFTLHNSYAQIRKMRTVPGQAGEPIVDKVLLKAFLGTDNPYGISPLLSAPDISRIEAGSSLTPKEVK